MRPPLERGGGRRWPQGATTRLEVAGLQVFRGAAAVASMAAVSVANSGEDGAVRARLGLVMRVAWGACRDRMRGRKANRVRGRRDG